MKKILGLDIGITSVGWGIVDSNTNRIIDFGVRLFDESDSENNLKRRGYRSNRRILRRRKQRILDMKELLIRNKIITKDFLPLTNPYQLRLKGLNEKLTNEELATVLLNYAKRRGSSLETVEESVSSSEQSAKYNLSINQEALKEKSYIVNVQLDRLEKDGILRGHQNNFKTTDYLIEVEQVLKNQNLSKEFNDKIIEIIKRRRHFSEGPGSLYSPSPYGRYRNLEGDDLEEIKNILKSQYSNQYLKKNFNIEHKGKTYFIFKNGNVVNKDPLNLIALMRGKCSIYTEELRAPKNSFSAELFNFLNDLNNLKFTNREEKITKNEKESLINHIRTKGSLTFKQLLKHLNVEEVDVSGFRIDKNQKPLITDFSGYKKILKIFNDLDKEVYDDQTIDKIVEILTETVVKEERVERINFLINDDIISEKLSELTGINGYHSLSLKAIYKLNNEMIEEPLNQQQIITNLNLRTTDSVPKLLLDESAILSPTAKRAHRETLKVVEELLKEHKYFEKIVIETTRDKNSSEERKRINDLQKHLEQTRKEAEEILGDFAPEYAKGSNILKLRLYKEQEGKCAYTGETIDLSRMISDPYSYEIDHIIPISVSYDDSFNNKVLVLPSANQAKGNKTPFGYFNSSNVLSKYKIKNFETFESYVLNNKNYKNNKKRNLLFKKDITKFEVLKEFINRNIVDTSYAIRSIMTTLKNYFSYHEVDTHIMTIKGKQTNLFRKIGRNLWNMKYPNSNLENPLNKDRDQYKHHAIDALIIAGLSNQKFIRKLYDISEKDEILYDRKTGEIINLDDPTQNHTMNNFLLEVANIKDEDVKFSWKIDTKPNRKLTDETIYSTRLVNDQHVVVKKYNDIYNLTKEQLEKILSEEGRQKLLVFKHDPKTFEIILNAFNQYKHEKKPLLAFKQEHGSIRKYSKKNNGPEIKALKYLEDNLGFHLDITPNSSVNKKVVKLQLSPYRADVYYSENEERYRFVTIRYTNILLGSEGYYIDENWYNEELKIKLIDNNYKFQFSLYRNNIIDLHREDKNVINIERYRFLTVNNDIKNTFEVKPLSNYERKQLMITIGMKIKKIIKYNVSVTGKASKVIKEDLKLKL